MDKDKERWSTRWKTKNWLRNSALSAIFSLTFVLQATHVRAGKERVEEHRHEPSVMPAFSINLYIVIYNI